MSAVIDRRYRRPAIAPLTRSNIASGPAENIAQTQRRGADDDGVTHMVARRTLRWLRQKIRPGWSHRKYPAGLEFRFRQPLATKQTRPASPHPTLPVGRVW